eukprot:12873826-Heterocapsa_arctica.AAC.1
MSCEFQTVACLPVHDVVVGRPRLPPSREQLYYDGTHAKCKRAKYAGASRGLGAVRVSLSLSLYPSLYPSLSLSPFYSPASPTRILFNHLMDFVYYYCAHVTTACNCSWNSCLVFPANMVSVLAPML